MKKYVMILIAASVGIQGCKDDSIENLEPSEETSSWIRLQDFLADGNPDMERFEPNGFGFAIGNKGYLAGGSFDVATFKEYNTETKQLIVKRSLEEFRTNLAAFSLGSMGYAGSGLGLAGGGEVYGLTDFYQYNPQTDTWSPKASLPESLIGAVGFSINGKGYIGVGSTDTVRFNEFGELEILFYPSRSLYEYDPGSDCWIKKADFPGEMRTEAVAFTIGNKAYVGTGLKFDRSGALRDFWEYDPNTNRWTKMPDFPGVSRSGAVGFSIGAKGYLGTGSSISNYLKDFWEYDPSSNSWKQLDDFAGGERAEMVYFSTGTKGYVAGGNGPLPYYQDFWEFDPPK